MYPYDLEDDGEVETSLDIDPEPTEVDAHIIWTAPEDGSAPERETMVLPTLKDIQPPSGLTEQLQSDLSLTLVNGMTVLEPHVGEIVAYMFTTSESRPAMVVRRFPGMDPFTVQLAVFTDGENDSYLVPDRVNAKVPMLLWRTSVHYSAERIPGTWHYLWGE